MHSTILVMEQNSLIRRTYESAISTLTQPFYITCQDKHVKIINQDTASPFTIVTPPFRASRPRLTPSSVSHWGYYSLRLLPDHIEALSLQSSLQREWFLSLAQLQTRLISAYLQQEVSSTILNIHDFLLKSTTLLIDTSKLESPSITCKRKVFNDSSIPIINEATGVILNEHTPNSVFLRDDDLVSVELRPYLYCINDSTFGTGLHLNAVYILQEQTSISLKRKRIHI